VSRNDPRARKAERKIEGARRRVEAAEQRVERELQRAAREIERATGPVWSRPEPGARRARFTREQIAEVALKIADEESIDAVSMRRVAGELGAGTMTLYHYVRTKDELLALMDNAIMGELVVPDEALSAGWREALTAIARRSHEAFERHPWILESSFNDAEIGPNGIRHMEQSVAAVSELDLDFASKMEIIHLIDEYVFGFAMHSRAPGPTDPDEQAEWRRRAFAYIDEQVATGDYPHLRELLAGGGMGEMWERIETAASDADRFDRGLRRVLDGIQLELERPKP
jgi:AcrR family transcriptional regulator